MTNSESKDTTRNIGKAADVSHILSDHCESMRAAAAHCMQSLPSPSYLSLGDSSFFRCGQENGCDVSLHEQRRQAGLDFWDGLPENDSHSSPKQGPAIAQIHMNDMSTASEFRKRFHDCNLPCLITGGLDDERNSTGSLAGSWFHRVSQEWGHSTDDSNRVINRDWFVEKLGAESSVPIRLQPFSQSTVISDINGQPEELLLDEDGRAQECETKMVTIEEWTKDIMLHQECSFDGEHPINLGTTSYYLKDWHLQLQLQQQGMTLYEASDNHQSPFGSLYRLPSIFNHDLLNAFLTRFTNGDYRFCYWGPRGSFTSRHSDVLHSFSWSYNVVGSKRWTFFDGNSNRRFSFTQNAGQAVFVPSTWQHEVVNLEETISINHNWITTANLDLCWECLITEMEAITKELDAWGIEDLEAHESMLRGCVGLDVTGFYLMVVVRLSELSMEASSTAEYSDFFVDVHRLAQMIQVLRDDKSLQLEGRLESVFQSRTVARDLLEWTDRTTRVFNFKESTSLNQRN